MIAAERVFLDLNNPRHEPVETENEAIAWLCENDDVFTLAKDISKIGLNPLELVAVVRKGSNSYFAPEGNRRLCAIKLLNDPDRAPANLRSRFQKLSHDWTPIEKLFCVEFPSRGEVRVWLDRIHGGRDEGRGRSSWNSEQKARNTAGQAARANELPMAVLDYAEENGLISKSNRKGKLAITQRFVSNPVFRNALGLTKTDDGFKTNLPKADFDSKLGRLMFDIVTDKSFKAHKYDKDRVIDYTNNKLSKLRQIESPKNIGAQSDSIEKPGLQLGTREPQGFSRPKSPTKIQPSTELDSLFAKMGNYKLQKLYYSICYVSARDHCPLIYVGLWSLVECLTGLDGRNPQTDFVSYLNANKLENLGFGDKRKTRSVRDAFENIQKYGNGTKHDGEAAGFNYEQLINDYQVIERVLIKLAQDCSQNP